MQEQLPRGLGEEKLNNSLLQNSFNIHMRAKRRRKKAVLTSPHPTLPIKVGLKSDKNVF